MKVRSTLASLALASLAAAQPFSIESFGAVAGVDTHQQALINGAAFAAAIAAANASSNPGQRAVLVPPRVYSFLPATPGFSNVNDLTIFIEGTLNVSTANFSQSFPGWPNPWAPLHFAGCTGLTITSTTGAGLVNGRGNLWWWYTILVADHRNNLLNVDGGSNFVLSNVTFLNAPQYHVLLSDMDGVVVSGTTVLVDIDDQVKVYRYMGGAPADAGVPATLRAAGRIGPLPSGNVGGEGGGVGFWNMEPEALRLARVAAIPDAVRGESWFDSAWDITPPVPMIWALNTDGIDFTGTNITVRNCSVTNFDDSVCVKPTPQCTSGVDISNVVVTWGVGVSMGSVPPDVGGNCISGVYAHNLTFFSPLKAIYIKPNPAKSDPRATGTIANVTYEDVAVHSPVWFTVFIGTQQQEQPGSAGTGCSFLYPLPNTSCPTDPQVTVANVTLRRVDVYSPLMSPGIMIANASNPAVGFVFEDVVYHNVSTWPVATGNFLCDSVQGVALGSTSPVPPCFTDATTAATAAGTAAG